MPSSTVQIKIKDSDAGSYGLYQEKLFGQPSESGTSSTLVSIAKPCTAPWAATCTRAGLTLPSASSCLPPEPCPWPAPCTRKGGTPSGLGGPALPNRLGTPNLMGARRMAIRPHQPLGAVARHRIRGGLKKAQCASLRLSPRFAVFFTALAFSIWDNKFLPGFRYPVAGTASAT